MLEPIPFAGYVEIGQMNNEPVAWMQTYKGEPNNIAWTKKDLEELGESIDYGYIPLYTHLVELTDFEIKGVLGLDECWIGEDSSMPNMIAFARAILRKASEK